VTELVTDLDLVAEQLWIAAGAPLSDAVRAAAARAAEPDRHAIEVRLAAEDPALAFAPVPGRVGAWTMPAGPGIRVDTALRPGDRVPPDYDPMIAKVMAVGRDRRTAIGRLRRGLDEIVVTGIQTTLPFDRELVRDAAFLVDDGSTLSTDWVAERWVATPSRERARAVAAIAAADASAEAPVGAVSLRKDTVPRSDRAWRRREQAIDRWPR
jgi:acetyl/propionyl-CoA carboxylase alpha subunit